MLKGPQGQQNGYIGHPGVPGNVQPGEEVHPHVGQMIQRPPMPGQQGQPSQGQHLVNGVAGGGPGAAAMRAAGIWMQQPQLAAAQAQAHAQAQAQAAAAAAAAQAQNQGQMMQQGMMRPQMGGMPQGQAMQGMMVHAQQQGQSGEEDRWSGDGM